MTAELENGGYVYQITGHRDSYLFIFNDVISRLRVLT